MSDLLNSASLVMIPSGYKEDVVYSQIPTDGSGDLSFTRASNGTRVNSAGLVEVCPWNLITYSEEFNNGSKALVNATIGVDVTTAPNGTTTADSLIENGANDLHAVYNFGALTYVAGVYSLSCYVKKGVRDWVRVQLYDGTNTPSVWANVNTGVLGTISSGATASIESVGNGWYRINVSYSMISALGGWAIYSSTADAQFAGYQGTNGATALYLWGLQINIGSTAKPYFPTTDRLNVPRLTYQNGGGGCPSLLLEKQSTNLVTWSEDLSHVDWTKQSGISVTANQTISPDGTQNADLVVGNGSSGIFQSGKTVSTTVANTKSVWLKGVSGGEVVRLQDPNQTVGYTSCTLTTSWQRFTLSEVQSGGSAGLWVTLIPSGGIYIWGAQLEDSSYPTSYIPTTNSSATRVADACYKTGISSLFGTNQGTFFIDLIYNNSNQFDYLFDVTDSSNTNRFLMYDTNGSGLYNFYDSGYSEITTYQFTKGQRYKIAVKYNSSGTIWYVNGTLRATGTVSFANQMSQIYLGTRFSLTNNVNMQVNESIVFPTALTNTELASLTTI